MRCMAQRDEETGRRIISLRTFLHFPGTNHSHFDRDLCAAGSCDDSLFEVEADPA